MRRVASTGLSSCGEGEDLPLQGSGFRVKDQCGLCDRFGIVTILRTGEERGILLAMMHFRNFAMRLARACFSDSFMARPLAHF